MGNLAFNTEMKPILEKMRANLKLWMQSNGDPGVGETERENP